jgi:hypothetical protein
MQVANALYTYAECTLCNCARCANILNTKWPARSLQQGSILLKTTVGLRRNHAEDQPTRMNTLRRGPMSPQESLPAPLTGKSERLNPNRLRNADSWAHGPVQGEDWSEPVRLRSADAPVSTPTLAYEHPWLSCSNSSATYQVPCIIIQ